jgi:hypothetical protein
VAVVDEIREALEQTVPDFSDRSGDWPGVLAAAQTEERDRRKWRKWPVAVVASVAAVAALALFWPAGDEGRGIIDRARAAVEGGPVIHVVLHEAPVEVYDLERHEYGSLPVVEEEWFDPARGLHRVRRVGSSVDSEAISRGPVRFPEGEQQYAGIATAYRRALSADEASLGPEETVQGRRVYWIRFSVRGAIVPVGSRNEVEVAVDAETFEPRFVRVDSGPVATVLSFETLASGEGNFTLTGLLGVGRETSSWSGASRVGLRSPAEARAALQNAVWLGERFGDLPLASIREVSWETGPTLGPPSEEPVRALELCYGSPERCPVSLTQATERRSGAAVGHGWPVEPPPGRLAFSEVPGLGYVVRNGVYITLLARNRDELVSAAKALTSIP